MQEIHPTAPEGANFPLGAQWRTGSGYMLFFNPHGDLQVVDPRGRAVWRAATNARAAKRLTLQTDGNVVIYDVDNRALWATNTDGNPGAFLVVQDDGNVVLYSRDRKPLWSTNTTAR